MANEEKIRILDEQPVENAGSLLYIRTLAGSSDASKPTSQLANGSVFIETDTGKVYIFDEDDGWTEMQAGGGGGGGEKYIVTLTPTSLDYSGTMDKTETEISNAYEAGKQIIFRIVGVPEYDHLDVNVTEALYNATYNRWIMSAYLVMLPNTLIYIYNSLTSAGDSARYWTKIYPLASSGGGVLVVHATIGDAGIITLDKTWQEIYDADYAVARININGRYYWQLINIVNDGEEYTVSFVAISTEPSTDVLTLVASSANGYPAYSE